MHEQTCRCSKYVTSVVLVTYITVCIVLGFYAAFSYVLFLNATNGWRTVEGVAAL